MLQLKRTPGCSLGLFQDHQYLHVVSQSLNLGQAFLTLLINTTGQDHKQLHGS